MFEVPKAIIYTVVLVVIGAISIAYYLSVGTTAKNTGNTVITTAGDSAVQALRN